MQLAVVALVVVAAAAAFTVGARSARRKRSEVQLLLESIRGDTAEIWFGSRHLQSVKGVITEISGRTVKVRTSAGDTEILNLASITSVVHRLKEHGPY